MKIKRIIIDSFRGFNKRQEFNVEESKLLLIYGPNGHGKTSFFDSIEWALTGKINRYDISSDERNRSKFVKNSFSDSIPLVQLYLDNNNYEIIITRRGIDDGTRTDYGKSELFIEANNEICFYDVAAEDYLNNLLIKEAWVGKINEENLNNMFNLTHYSSQEKMNHFLKGAKESERYDALSTILGTEQFNSFKEKFKVVQSKFKENLANIQNVIDIESNKVEMLNKEISRISLSDYHYNALYIEELLKKYNDEFGKKFDSVGSNNDLINTIHEDNSKIFLENNEITGKEDLIKTIEKEYANYYQSYYNLSDFKSKLTELQRFSKLNSDLSKADWLIVNFDDFIKSKELLESKIVLKNEHMSNINFLEEKIQLKKDVIMFLKLEFENFIKSRSYESFKINVLQKVPENYENFSNMMVSKVDEAQLIINKIEDKKQSSENIKKEISNHEAWLQSLESINQQYSMVLRATMDYLTAIEEIHNCPICGNDQVNSSDLMLYVKNAQKVVNNDIPEIQIKLTDLKNSLINNESELKVFNEELNLKINAIRNELSKFEESILTDINELNRLIQTTSELNESILLLEKLPLNYISVINEFKLSEINLPTINELIIKIDNEIKTLIEKYNFSVENLKSEELSLNNAISKYIYNINMFKSLLDRIEFNENKFDPNTIKSFIENYKYNLQVKKLQIDAKMVILQNLLKEVENLKIYQELLTKKNELNSYISKIENLKDTRNQLDTKIKVLDEAIKGVPTAIEKLNENAIKGLLKLIQTIYSKLNSHPIFNEIDFKTEKRYGNFKLILNVLTDNNVEANPTFIYSAAQINTVALSIFLSMAVTQKWSNLDFIALDDPIQSMDSLNSLSFIDFLRQLIDNDGYNKQLIISTHDSMFFEMIKKKFHMFNVAIIEFKGYSEKGPIFIGEYEEHENPVKLIKANRLGNFKEVVANI